MLQVPKGNCNSFVTIFDGDKMMFSNRAKLIDIESVFIRATFPISLC